jgi:hypothetical protein
MARRKDKDNQPNPRGRMRLIERREFVEDSLAAQHARDDRAATVPWTKVRD